MKQRIYIALVTGILVLGLTPSCKKDNDNGQKSSGLEQKDILDVAYGTDSLQTMDVYLPANRTAATKTLILVHGGAWTTGDKSDFNTDIEVLRSRLSDYAIFNVNMRLATQTGDNKWPAPMDDINAACNFIYTKGTEYTFNPEKVAILGASSGAQLALLQAYKFNTGHRIKVVADLFGPTDLADLYNNPPMPNYPLLLSIFLSGNPTNNAASYTSASPLEFVTPQVPPTIIFHGTADPLVPMHQSDSLYQRLTDAGVTVKYKTYAGEGHGWVGTNLDDTYNEVIKFFKDNME